MTKTVQTDDCLSLPDLVDALGDAAGLLDKVVEHIGAHRRGAVEASTKLELHAVEDFTSQGWAYTRQARTVLRDLLATTPALIPTTAVVQAEAATFELEPERGLLP